jgi:hypothetical protein
MMDAVTMKAFMMDAVTMKAFVIDAFVVKVYFKIWNMYTISVCFEDGHTPTCVTLKSCSFYAYRLQ